MHRSKLQSWFAVVALCACVGAEPDHEGQRGDGGSACNDDDALQTTSYDSIRAAYGATTATVNLCPLVRLSMFEAAGLYRVVSLESEYEEDLSSPGLKGPFTYVELELLEPWFNASGNATARISGGRHPCGTEALWRISLHTGETVGVLLLDRTPENRNHFGMHPLGTFKQSGAGRFTNGQLVIDPTTAGADLGEMVTAIAEADDDAPCPYDVSPSAR